MSNKPLVSVCMVAYNHESFIKQAIEGVLMQKGDFNLHLIIGDDASKDKTGIIYKEYAERYPQKISFFQNKTNLGTKRNFYKTMNMITGEYMAFCEGDDYWTDSNKLNKQINFLEENKDYNICFHRTQVLLKDGRLVNDFITKVPCADTTVDDLIRAGNYIHTPSVVYRNNFTIPPWYWECPIGDYPLYVLAAKNGKIKCLNEFMAVYRYGGRFSRLHPVKKRLAFLIALNELIKNCPDEKIKVGLIKKQKKEFHCFLLIYLLLGKRDIDDLKMVTQMPVNSLLRFLILKFIK